MSSFNFDVGNIEYNPSTKDLDAFEMHHILSDNMFKPIKKVRFFQQRQSTILMHKLMNTFSLASIVDIVEQIYN